MANIIKHIVFFSFFLSFCRESESAEFSDKDLVVEEKSPHRYGKGYRPTKKINPDQSAQTCNTVRNKVDNYHLPELVNYDKDLGWHLHIKYNNLEKLSNPNNAEDKGDSSSYYFLINELKSYGLNIPVDSVESK